MLLTISTTHQPATDLGYLLHKHPSRFQSFRLSFGEAYVFYPEATATACTAALLVEVDPVRLVRRDGSRGTFALEPYVNDRPYVASSFLSVAIGDTYGSALGGTCKDRPTLVDTPIPLRARLAVVRCRGGEALLQRLFAPLGYTTVEAVNHPLDERFPEWGPGPYYTIELATTARLHEMLRHLVVLIPVLDDEKHYWVGEDELEKLLRRGEGWLESHPERALIADRYLSHRRGLVREAIARLAGPEAADPDAETETRDKEEDAVEAPIHLHAQRLDAVASVLRDSGARRVLDLGCGEGKLIRLLLETGQFREIVGVDVSSRALEWASRRLRLDQAPARDRVTLVQGALTYRDRRLTGFDAAAAVEVIEHLDPHRLTAFERSLFQFARPTTVVVTTPNSEYNVLFPRLPAGGRRHRDHRFEWTRSEFRAWATEVSERQGYDVEIVGIGPEDPHHGMPSQMAVFTRVGATVTGTGKGTTADADADDRSPSTARDSTSSDSRAER